jgi:plastocyanin
MCFPLREKLPLQGLRITLLTSLLTLLSVFTFSSPGRSAEPSGSPPGKDPAPATFDIATLDRMADSTVQWVAAGGGVLAYGAGVNVNFALDGDPFSPVSQLTLDGVISEALVLGKYALLSEEGSGIRLIDLSVPASPRNLGFYPLIGTTFRLANWGNLLFVAGSDPGVRIFKLSFASGQDRPFDLVEEEVIPVADPILALTAWESKLYAATEREIKVYDVSDPSVIVEIDSLPITLPARSMAVNGDSLFIAAGAEGLHVVDLSAPGNAASLAIHPVQSESVHLAGRLVYLAAGSDGLQRLQAGPIAATTFSVGVGLNGNHFFSPASINIIPGDTINWVWGSNFHSTTSGTSCTPNGMWNSGELDTGSTFQFTFSAAGSFPYFSSVGNDCPSGMVGTVNVAGAGPTMNISVTPASVNFGNISVGHFLDQTLTITNQAGSTAALTGSVGTLAAPFSVQSGGGAFNLSPGQSASVIVRFSPTAAGAVSTNLSITHNATNQASPTSIPLSGTGAAPGGPNVVISFISGPITGKPGGRIAIQNTMTNQGDQKASVVTVNFYLSADTQIDPGDTFIGKRTVRNLAPGASSGPVSTMVTLPRNILQGAYFIGAISGTNTNFDPNGIAVCPSLPKPKLLSPKNRGTNISTTSIFTWSNVTGASSYEVQVATDSGFTNIVASATGLTDSQWAVAPALAGGTTYFWRSRAVNPCGAGPWSAAWNFKTT